MKTTRSERDSLAIDYARVLKEMNGISPKLAKHAELKAEAEEMYKRLGKLASNVEIKGKRITIVKPKNYLQSHLKPKPRRTCLFPGCTKLGMTGKKKGTFRPWCNEHRTGERREQKIKNATPIGMAHRDLKE